MFLSDGKRVQRIRDDDAPLISIQGGSTYEGNPGDSQFLRFTVALDHELKGAPLTIEYQIDSFEPSTLTFEPGEQVKSIGRHSYGDLTDELDQDVHVRLLGASRGTIVQIRGDWVDPR